MNDQHDPITETWRRLGMQHPGTDQPCSSWTRSPTTNVGRSEAVGLTRRNPSLRSRQPYGSSLALKHGKPIRWVVLDQTGLGSVMLAERLTIHGITRVVAALHGSRR